MLISIPYLGKTTFIFYLLLHRLEQKLPTAVQLDDDYYFIFDEQGAVHHSATTRDPRLQACWALTDSNEHVVKPCASFAALAKRVIQVKSPKPKKWKGWVKQAEAHIIILDLPPVPEIAAIA